MIETRLARSGARVVSDGQTVTKSWPTEPERIRRAALKQAAFGRRGPVGAAQVLEIGFDGFKMKHVGGKHVGEWTPEERSYVTAVLLDWCEGSVRVWAKVSPEIFRDKLEQLVRYGAPIPAKLYDDLDKVSEWMPFGPTHGDLTLCNAILRPDASIKLVDFDSPFIESPALDAAKVMQDASLGWWAHALDQPFDYNEDRCPLDFATEFASIITPLLALTVLRIWPYARDVRDKNWIKEALCRLSY